MNICKIFIYFIGIRNFPNVQILVLIDALLDVRYPQITISESFFKVKASFLRDIFEMKKKTYVDLP